MGLYEPWCEATKEEDKRKRYWTYVEKDGGRAEISGDLAETIRSHYNPLELKAEDVARLGYKVAAEILKELPSISAVYAKKVAQLTAALNCSDAR